MELRDYLHVNKIKKKDFAAKLEYSIPYFGRICEGLKKPSKRLAKAIEIATDGEVTIREMLGE
jgi:DNA-binding transcriptional regulator YdaS (Cro superfamily)